MKKTIFKDRTWGYRFNIMDVINILFLKRKGQNVYFTVCNIPIGWIMVIISVIVSIIINLILK